MNKALKLSLLLSALALVVLGLFYGIGAPYFGKAIVGYWSFGAIPLALALLIGVYAGRRGMVEICCWLSVLLQVIPIACWLFMPPGFYVLDVYVPGLLGAGVHLAVIIWSLINYKIVSQAIA